MAVPAIINVFYKVCRLRFLRSAVVCSHPGYTRFSDRPVLRLSLTRQPDLPPPEAGPVVAAAVILKKDAEFLISDVNDSKKLSAKKRETLYGKILKSSISFGIGLVSADEVCKIVGVKKPTLWRWSKIGYLVPVKVGRKNFYQKSDLDALSGKKGVSDEV